MHDWRTVVVLTVDRASDWVGFGVVGHTADELRTDALAVLFDSVDLRDRGRRVCAEDGLAVFTAVRVSPCVTAAY